MSALLSIAPWLTTNSRILHMVIIMLMNAVLGMAWNLLGGFGGQISFGHAMFFGVGAYTFTLLALGTGVHTVASLLAGGLLAALFALAIGAILFYLRGPFFALGTLAVAEILRLLVSNWSSLTGGGEGRYLVGLPPLRLGGGIEIPLEGKSVFLYGYLILFLITFLVINWLVRSRLGYYLLAIRSDPDAAEALGVNTTACKVVTFAISAFFTGLAGGIYAAYLKYIDPESVMAVGVSASILFVAIMGGLATTWGPLVGAVVALVTGELFEHWFDRAHLLSYGIFLVLVILYMPQGVYGFLRQRFAARGRPAVPPGPPPTPRVQHGVNAGG